MRIALLTREYPPDTLWGGEAVGYHELATALARHGHEVHVVSQAVGSPGDLIEDGVFVHRVGTNATRNSARALFNYSLGAYRKLNQLIRERNVEVVDGPYGRTDVALCSLRKRVPLVVEVHGSVHRSVIDTDSCGGRFGRAKTRLLASLVDFGARRADRVIAISPEALDEMVNVVGVNPENVSLVYHVRDLDKYKPTPSNFRERAGIASDMHMVLFVGRLERRKGVHVLCDAIGEVIKAGCDNAKFVFVGRDSNTAPRGGSFREFVLGQAESHGWADRLLLIDFLPDSELVEAYSACDVLVAPSLHEIANSVPLEAMACGKPVVATRTGIVPELALDGTNGVAVAPGDSRELAGAIVQVLLYQDEHRDIVARRNREIVEARISVDRWVDQMLAVYRSAIGQFHGA